MAVRLNQIIAIEKGVKARVYSALSEMNKAIQKPDIFNGFAKSYQKADEAGEDLPAESKRVQHTVAEVLATVRDDVASLVNVTARKDFTNCVASADVVVDGTTLIVGAPVTFLLFLEKHITDLRTFFGNLPVLDDAEDWTFDENATLFKSRETKTHRTKKVQRPIVLYDATDKHPAQTQLLVEDVIAGHWSTTKHSGAIPKWRRQELVARADTLLNAVKMAREKANMADEIAAADGAAVMNWLLKE